MLCTEWIGTTRSTQEISTAMTQKERGMTVTAERDRSHRNQSAWPAINQFISLGNGANVAYRAYIGCSKW